MFQPRRGSRIEDRRSRHPFDPQSSIFDLRPSILSIPSQRDSAVDAGDGDRRAAVAYASAQLATPHFADHGDRQVGIDAAIDAVDVNLGVSLGRQAYFDAPV